MPRHQPSIRLAAALLLASPLWAPLPALAQGTGAAPAQDQQVIVPQVERRELKLPRIASKDIEVGAYFGTYATQNFGASSVYGLRLGYHLSEDLFAVATLGQTKVSDEAFRQVLPGGVIADGAETLRYTHLSLGYNLLPGEVFVGRNQARASALYLLGGIGTTRFNQQKRQTFNYGGGLRVYLSQRSAVQVEMRDHMFTLDQLGKRQSTHNLEMTAGISFFF